MCFITFFGISQILFKIIFLKNGSEFDNRLVPFNFWCGGVISNGVNLTRKYHDVVSCTGTDKPPEK